MTTRHYLNHFITNILVQTIVISKKQINGQRELHTYRTDSQPGRVGKGEDRNDSNDILMASSQGLAALQWLITL